MPSETMPKQRLPSEDAVRTRPERRKRRTLVVGDLGDLSAHRLVGALPHLRVELELVEGALERARSEDEASGVELERREPVVLHRSKERQEGQRKRTVSASIVAASSPVLTFHTLRTGQLSEAAMSQREQGEKVRMERELGRLSLVVRETMERRREWLSRSHTSTLMPLQRATTWGSAEAMKAMALTGAERTPSRERTTARMSLE